MSNVAGDSTNLRHVVRLAPLLEVAMNGGLDMQLYTSRKLAGDECEALIELCGEVSVF